MKIKYYNSFIKIVNEKDFNKRIKIACETLAKGIYIKSIKEHNEHFANYTESEKKELKENILGGIEFRFKINTQYYRYEDEGSIIKVICNPSILDNYDNSLFYSIYDVNRGYLDYMNIFEFFIFTNACEDRIKMLNHLVKIMNEPKQKKKKVYYDSDDDVNYDYETEYNKNVDSQLILSN